MNPSPFATENFLVAAGVVLCRNQHQARAAWFGWLLRTAAEGVQNYDDGRVRGENAQANGGDYGKEEDCGHH